jgi:hypothetical protein
MAGSGQMGEAGVKQNINEKRPLLRKFVFSCYAVVDPSKGKRQWWRRGAGDNALTLDCAKIVKFEVMQWP